MLIIAFLMAFAAFAPAQQIPSTPFRPWSAPASRENPSKAASEETHIDETHIYSLSELMDLSERHNPETRATWEIARQRLAQLRIEQSEWFPRVTAIGLANSNREGVLFGTTFVRQTLGLFEPFVRVSYTIFDFGQRSQRIAEARSELRAADLAFNSTHLSILFETSRLYYQYLNAQGQQQAAEVNLKDAETVRASVEARLSQGLSTLPDALEARSAVAQAEYQLQSIVGDVQIARGALLSELGAGPTVELKVQPLSTLAMPPPFDEEADASIERALKQRPEFAQRIAERQSALSSVAGARRAYLPSLNFSGDGGEVRAYGQQNQLPRTYAGPAELWNTSLTLEWKVFDGGRREAELARAHALEKRAQSEIDATRDQIELEVWSAYVNLRTAYRQREAAAALLIAAQSSYDAALESYNYGLRNTIDVLNAQRLLAQAISQDVAARTGLLARSAEFACRTGDLLSTSTRPSHP